ncbi:TonB-dependent receptor plug domain-containing protein [Aequorivita sp. F47161]|uniref:TonB-dependent receptor plug domain-containing protein n=1 Tax=Aequorivita vitellina TaxID=2874475 RepID=A0A9X1QYP2_9FLAO|nr:MG2 domain-containing protein [Aequorivita vitellina]MCG2418994.1 TonB-dependent receptor plug domain-containing protein [Aequorivita vitellina]
MKKILAIATIAFMCLAFSFGNVSGLKLLILNRLKDYTTKNYPEKIYIQTDRPYYTAGESIWFNAYLVNGVTHKKSTKSKVIYVELINEQNEVISDRKIFAESLSVDGDFKLPVNLPEGVYLLRAFTNYMRNQSREYFFKKEIPVFALNSDSLKKEDDEASKLAKNTELPDIGFYPEGGYLVNGINSRVAVKIKDAELTASPVAGIIEDTDGNKITDFKTHEFGLGSFFLKPEPGKEYRAVISNGDENILYPLPIPLSEGYVMNTSITDDEVIINVATNKKEGLKNTLIIGQQRGLAAFDYTQYNDTSTLLVKIPTADLVEGVLDIVLFNNSEKPVAERLVFIKKEEKLSLSVKKTNGLTTGLRDRVNLEIAVRDKMGRLVPNTLSISVTDAVLIKPDDNAENIKTYLLLNSDLRGKIKSPNYFFTPGDTIKKNHQLDLIMLTHGWRRFTWQELLENSSPQKFQPEDGIYISGYTLNAKSPFQNKVSETKLTFRKNGFYQEAESTDNNGRFSYGPFVYTDTIDVFFQAGENLSTEKPNYKDTNIKLDPPAQRPTVIPDRIFNPFNQKLEIANLETYRKKTRSNVFRDFQFDQERELLDEVVVAGKGKKTEEEIKEIKREKRTRPFSPSHRIVVDELGAHGSGDFMELIANVPGVRIGRKQGKGNETSQDFEVNLRGMKPAFYLDNVEVDLVTARTVHQAEIDFIDIMNTGHASAAYGLKAQGVIAIYTKQGSDSKLRSIEKKPGSINFKLEGFYAAREFYAPDYSLVDRNNPRPDRRTTLYWKPSIVSNGYKKTELVFYSGDVQGKFQIKIEGITEAGIPFYTTSFLDVQ